MTRVVTDASIWLTHAPSCDSPCSVCGVWADFPAVIGEDWSMTDTKALVAAFADRLERREWVGLAELLDPDVVYEMPQTRERILGRDKYLQFNIEYPGDWHLEPKVVLGDDHDGSLLFRWRLGDEDGLAIAFFEVADGYITKITDFWPEPYEPPPGREHLVERW